MKKFNLAITLLLSTLVCSAEKNIIADQLLLRQHLSRNQYDIDTSAAAIILSEKGTSTILNGSISYKIERTVKILKKDAINDLGMVNIAKGSYTNITKVKGITFNMEDGEIKKQITERSDMLKDKIEENLSILKFNLPSITEGSVIYYTYTTTSPGNLFVPDWDFQGEYPTLHSEYEITLPSYIYYTAIERGNNSMKPVATQDELDQCEACSYTVSYKGDLGETTQIFTRRNIPAIKKEPHMSSVKNHQERIKIHVTALSFMGHSRKILNNWEDVIKKNHMGEKGLFNQVFTKNPYLKKTTDSLTSNQTTSIEKAKAIFRYVRENIQNQTNNTEVNIKTIFQQKSGNSTSINLLLASMLRKADLDCVPIILNTREKEKLNAYFPDLKNVNYVACKLTIDKKNYFLDASQKYIPFGTLLAECYNGYARTVEENSKEITLSPDSIKNKTTSLVFLSPSEQEKDKLTMKVDLQYGLFTAMENRKEWLSDTLKIKKMIQSELHNRFKTFNFNNYSIKNLNDPEAPLSIQYTVTLDFNSINSIIYFDPNYNKIMEKNPFPLTQRNYPIEMEYLQDINYILNFKLPENYILDDYPKSNSLKLDTKGRMAIRSITDYDEANRTFSMNTRFSTTTNFFDVKEYTDIQLFYNAILEEQNKKIVLKKAN